MIIDVVESILAQSILPKTIVIVDDGSTDSTLLELKKMNTSKVYLQILKQENLGVSVARNKGAAICNSKFIAFVDDDDIWTTNAGNDFINAFNEYSADVVTGCFQRVNKANEKSPPEKLWDGKGSILNILSERNVIGTTWTMVRKSFFDKSEGFDESLTHCEDWDLFIRLAKLKAKFVFIDKTVALYREPIGPRLMDNEEKLIAGRLYVINKNFNDQT